MQAAVRRPKDSRAGRSDASRALSCSQRIQLLVLGAGLALAVVGVGAFAALRSPPEAVVTPPPEDEEPLPRPFVPLQGREVAGRHGRVGGGSRVEGEDAPPSPALLRVLRNKLEDQGQRLESSQWEQSQLHSELVKTKEKLRLALAQLPQLPDCDEEPTHPWLVIGIPTVARRDALDYLNPALDYIVEQLPDPKTSQGSLLKDRVRILVLNNGHGKKHPAFDKAVARFNPKANPMGRYLKFETNPDPATHSLKSDLGSANHPGAKVRQQTVDMASLMEASAALKPDLFFLMEDDFRLCPHFFQVLDYAVAKMSRVQPTWIALRISYGLAGAVVPGKDIAALADYLRRHVERRPPDHLLVEWFAGESPESARYKMDRQHFAFRHNLLQHFGTVSSLRGSRQGRFAGCYEALDTGSLFEVEAFKKDVCPNEDVWPCPPMAWTEAHPALGLGHLEGQVYRVDHGGGPVTGLRDTDKVKKFGN